MNISVAIHRYHCHLLGGGHMLGFLHPELLGDAAPALLLSRVLLLHLLQSRSIMDAKTIHVKHWRLLVPHSVGQLLDLCHVVVHLALHLSVHGWAGQNLALQFLHIFHLPVDLVAHGPDLLDVLEVGGHGALDLVIHGDSEVLIIAASLLLHGGQSVLRHGGDLLRAGKLTKPGQRVELELEF